MKVLFLGSDATYPGFVDRPRGTIGDSFARALHDAGDHWIGKSPNGFCYGGDGHQPFACTGADGQGLIDTEPCDWVISFGHREILKRDFIDRFPGRIINIHISILPWNRGSDPNFWSWFDGTPKGVTIHQITPGLDTGPILAQSHVPLSNAHTLRSSYDVLMREAAALFAWKWPDIRAGNVTPVPQPQGGSYHRSADKAPWMKLLGYGLDEPCSKIEALGRQRVAA